ncbi:alpha/beta fold hydrolase [Sphaerisporangium sp. NPDC005289]|uniref:alpha/beta hydrolase family protein n=1 Tax=Sphaerisporangium sp. NPDC005289 TaxID=3155247 RepID=UPI0033A602F1
MRAIVGLAALVMALSACGGETGATGTTAAGGRGASAGPSASGTPAATPSAAPAPTLSPSPKRPLPKGPNLSGCYTRDDGKIFTYGEEKLPGVVMGKGATGVVISYERGGNACTWRPLADRLVSAGYRVLLYARDLEAIPEDNIVDMARRLDKERGVGRIVLAGGSMGGTLSVSAALKLGDRVAAVVALAGPPLPEEAARLRVPLLQIAGVYDGDRAQRMRESDDAAVLAPDRQVVVVPDESAHASSLFETPHGPQVLDTIMAFVNRHGT